MSGAVAWWYVCVVCTNTCARSQIQWHVSCPKIVPGPRESCVERKRHSKRLPGLPPATTITTTTTRLC